MGALARGGAIEVASDVMAGIAGEIDLLDGVAVALDLAVDDRLERFLLRHRPESGGDQDLLAEGLFAGLPCLARRWDGKVEVLVVECADTREPAVGGLLVRWQDLGWVGVGEEREAAEQERWQGKEEEFVHGVTLPGVNQCGHTRQSKRRKQGRQGEQGSTQPRASRTAPGKNPQLLLGFAGIPRTSCTQPLETRHPVGWQPMPLSRTGVCS